MRRSIVTVVAMILTSWTAAHDGRLHAQAQPRSVAANESKLRGFIVTLALGEVEPGKTTGTFTPGATKALADLKDFLPYKSYRLVDTVWTLGLNGPHQFLRGPDGEKHEFYMRSRLLSEAEIKVDLLRLWDSPSVKPEATSTPLLIDTGFNLALGETVVVGTSRIDSSRGLIVLVTAAPK